MDKPNQIYTFANADIQDEVKTRPPCAETCWLRRVRAPHQPRDPQTPQELVLTDEWTTTLGENPVTFLLYDNGPDADERVLFATVDHMHIHATSDTWCMDGNFHGHTHLYAVVCKSRKNILGVCATCIYGLVTRSCIV